VGIVSVSDEGYKIRLINYNLKHLPQRINSHQSGIKRFHSVAFPGENGTKWSAVCWMSVNADAMVRASNQRYGFLRWHWNGIELQRFPGSRIHRTFIMVSWAETNIHACAPIAPPNILFRQFPSELHINHIIIMISGGGVWTFGYNGLFNFSQIDLQIMGGIQVYFRLIKYNKNMLLVNTLRCVVLSGRWWQALTAAGLRYASLPIAIIEGFWYHPH
jgi:hypothetical protein